MINKYEFFKNLKESIEDASYHIADMVDCSLVRDDDNYTLYVPDIDLKTGVGNDIDFILDEKIKKSIALTLHRLNLIEGVLRVELYCQNLTSISTKGICIEILTSERTSEEVKFIKMLKESGFIIGYSHILLDSNIKFLLSRRIVYRKYPINVSILDNDYKEVSMFYVNDNERKIGFNPTHMIPDNETRDMLLSNLEKYSKTHTKFNTYSLLTFISKNKQ